MDLDAARAFVRENHRGVLSTYRQDGRPQLSPILASVDSAGLIVISSREPAMKVRNLRRDNRVSYCGFSDKFFGDWVQIDGIAEIISLPEAMDPLISYYRSVAGEHEDWATYRAAMTEQRRVIIAIHPERAGPDVAG